MGTETMRDANEVVLRPMRPEDLDQGLALLREANLPLQGVAEDPEAYTVAESAGGIVGMAGIERYGRHGLLRSVAVSPEWRGRGLGGALTEEILARAERDGLEAVYLLTDTAAEFFPRYGFRRIERSDVAESVRTSAEFTDLCPASSVVMVRSCVAP
jgi:amino-acid N-acetyltransferase